jgi:L-fucose mutarotase
MLRGISPLIGPDLLGVLHRMGHGDELVLADVYFPAESLGRRVVRADGHRVTALLDGILPLIPLDRYVASPTMLMAPVSGDRADPAVALGYRQAVLRHHPWTPEPIHLPREEFYAQARTAFAIVVTGETARYGNLILRHGNDA